MKRETRRLVGEVLSERLVVAPGSELRRRPNCAAGGGGGSRRTSLVSACGHYTCSAPHLLHHHTVLLVLFIGYPFFITPYDKVSLFVFTV